MLHCMLDFEIFHRYLKSQAIFRLSVIAEQGEDDLQQFACR